MLYGLSNFLKREPRGGLQEPNTADQEGVALDLSDEMGLNGIEAARQIRKVSYKSKILFVTQESSANACKKLSE